jgi:hypothetical protein
MSKNKIPVHLRDNTGKEPARMAKQLRDMRLLEAAHVRAGFSIRPKMNDDRARR